MSHLIAKIKPNKLEEFLKRDSANKSIYHSLGNKFKIKLANSTYLKVSPILLPQYGFSAEEVERFMDVVPDRECKDFEFEVVYSGSKELMEYYLNPLFNEKALDFKFKVELKPLFSSSTNLCWFFKDYREDFCLSHEGFTENFSLTFDSIMAYLKHKADKQAEADNKLKESRMNPKNIASQRYNGSTVQSIPLELVVEKKVVVRDLEITKQNIQEVFKKISEMLED